MPNQPKIAIAHDFFFQNGGAENVVEALLELYPDADIYTTIFIVDKFKNNIELTKAWQSGRIITTPAQGFFVWNNGFWLKYFKHFFWLYPLLMRLVHIQNYDCLIISSTDCAKQVRITNVKKIIHYCHTPTRYLHGLTTEQDHKALNPILQMILPIFEYFLRKLDLNAVSYLNRNNCQWIANSQYIQGLILKIYDSSSTVIYPPVDISKFSLTQRNHNKTDTNSGESYYLCHGRISFHKRLDIAIIACLNLGRHLKISGVSGLESQMQDLRNIVDQYLLKHPDKIGLIEFLGRTTDDQLQELVANCEAFLFPGKEDFGIAPVEMLASGVPLIAYGSGGALEYVESFVNGILVPEQSVKGFEQGILQFEQVRDSLGWNENRIRQSSLPFTKKIFWDGISGIVKK